MLLSVFTVSFFGHRKIDDLFAVEKVVEKLVRTWIREKDYVQFLVGRDGDFDQIVSSSIIRAQRDIFDANSTHTCVFPYLKAEYRDNAEAFQNYYDEIEICDRAAIAHPKAAIQIRNRDMVDRSDLCIFYVDRDSGGAWQTLQYAIKQEKPHINIADNIPDAD